MNPSDDDLRMGFRRLRAEDARAAPAFRAVLGRRHTRHLARRRLPTSVQRVAAVAGAMVALGLLLVALVRRPVSAPPPSSADTFGGVVWHAPTDFLLDTPGHEIIADLPGTDATLGMLWEPAKRRNP